ncbi:MAG TPA: 30S ribosome-binding factor RbfA [Archangium sp.]|uniref:30S ribosome-binding factor RbfA n=1 Tax=Archangium sp. TaxID=1872627 RepID=UPI002E36EDE1|nr:30S ribosome-binding factor RbfA [Archangium sp.]HEX5751938.1 30S ribosome-binding factor RbfA [Archangium sp.]
MSTSNRPERVGQEIQAALGRMLTRGELKDPRIGFITITGVKVSPDLKTARVYYSMMGSEQERKETQKGLEAAKGYIRREITEAVNLRVSPEVFFTFDESLERGDRIERLLREVKDKEGW